MPHNSQQLWQQAQNMIGQQLAGLISQTEGVYGRRSKQGRRAIRGMTRAFADELAAIGQGVEGVYDAAEGERAAMNAAMGQYMSGRGSKLANRLGADLQAIDAPSMAPAQAQANLGTSLAQQGMAIGGANLARLMSEGTADESYQKALPGTAVLAGVQNARDYETRMTSQLEGAIAQINAQRPSLVQGLYGSLADAHLQEQQMRFQRNQSRLDRAERAEDRKAAGGAGSERRDSVLAALQGHLQGQLPQVDPATGQQIGGTSDYSDLVQTAKSFLRLYFPDMPEAQLVALASGAVNSIGIQAPMMDGWAGGGAANFPKTVQRTSGGGLPGGATGVDPMPGFIYGGKTAIPRR